VSVLGDAKQLQVIFMHLLVNAEQACRRDNARGHIRVQLSSDTLEQQVRIEVEDNGPGIPAEIQNHVFEPFSTTKIAGRGIGLGLSIVRAVVQTHKGQVSFETATGKGTTFVIELPMLVHSQSLTNQAAAPPEV
jgi:signal transduction histidine kinase